MSQKTQLEVKHKRIRPKLQPEQKLARHNKALRLTQDLASAREDYVDLAKTIAKRHDRSVPWASRALHLGGRLLRKKRIATTWNAFVHRELRAVNDDLPAGSRYRLPAFMTKNRDELLKTYAALTEKERKDLVDSLVTIRAEREQVQRSNPKAMLKDVDATFMSMDEEFHAVGERTGVKSFYMSVRGDIEHHHQPKMYFAEEARDFFVQCLGLDPDRIALQFEAWVIAGPDKVIAPKRSVSQEVSECRSLIQEGLAAILILHGIPDKPRMNYANYERQVVELWGVVLKGWTSEKVVNPGELGARQKIKDLLAALKSKACKWVMLTEEGLEERIAQNKARAAAGEQIYTQRKKSVGRRGMGAKSAKSSEFVNEENDVEMTD